LLMEELRTAYVRIKAQLKEARQPSADETDGAARKDPRLQSVASSRGPSA